MKATMLDLPDELLLHILSYVEPYVLFHDIRLVNRHYQLLSQDVFAYQILPRLQLSLSIYVEAHTHNGQRLPSMNADISFRFQELADSGRYDTTMAKQIAVFKIEQATPKGWQRQAVQKWKAMEVYGGAGIIMRVALPGKYLIPFRGREWWHCCSPTARDDHSLSLEWKKIIAVYLKEAKKFDDASRDRPMFPMY